MSDKFGDKPPGTLVLYKLGRLPPWPAMVMDDAQIPAVVTAQKPKKTAKKRDICIWFFQSRDYYWVAKEQMQDFDHGFAKKITEEEQPKLGQKKLREAYLEALRMLRGEWANDDDDDDDDDDDVEIENGGDRQNDGGRSSEEEEEEEEDFENNAKVLREPERKENPNKKRKLSHLSPSSPSLSSPGETATTNGPNYNSYIARMERYEPEDDVEEPEYETIAVRTKETIKKLIFMPVARGRKAMDPNASVSLPSTPSGTYAKKKLSKKAMFMKEETYTLPVELSLEDAQQLHDMVLELNWLRPKFFATDQTNVMKLVETYDLPQTLTDFRNHFIRGDVVQPKMHTMKNGMDFEQTADELLKHWWAVQNLNELMEVKG